MKSINKIYLAGLSLITVFAIGGFTVWNSVQSKDLERVFIENKTRSLIVESIKESEQKNNQRLIEVSLQNRYDRPIAAYRIRQVEDFDGKIQESGVERGGLLADWVFNPNEVKVERFYINSTGKTRLIIAAVIFEDGTGDGENNELNRLQEIRAGVRMGFQKIVSIFQEMAKTDESFSSTTALESLAERIKQLDDKEIPDDSKRGFALAKSYVGIELKDLAEAKNRNPGFDAAAIRAKLAKIESVLTKLSVNPPPESAGKQRRRNED